MKTSKYTLLEYCQRYKHTRVRIYLVDSNGDYHYIENVQYSGQLLTLDSWLIELLESSFNKKFKYYDSSSICVGKFKEIVLYCTDFVIEDDFDGSIKDYYRVNDSECWEI